MLFVEEKVGKESYSWEGCYSCPAVHLPYRFVEQEVLRNFAQGFVELGASRGCVPASEFIVGHFTVHRDIVSKLPYIQAIIRSSLQESAELGGVSVIRDLHCVTCILTLM